MTRPRGWRSARLSVPPDSATGANSHCTKTGAGVLLWPGGGRLAAEDAQDVPGAASCFLWEQNSRDYSAAGRRVDSRWAWCGLGAPLRTPRPALAPAVPCLVSPALAALRPRTPRGSVETERVPHTLLSPTRMAGLIPRYILSYGLGEQTQSSLWPHSRSCTLTAYLLPCPPVRGRPTCGSPAGTLHFLENYTFPCIKTCTPLGPRG